MESSERGPTAPSDTAISRADYEAALVRSMLDESPEAFFLKDVHSRFVMVSKALAARFGADPEDVVGRTDADYFVGDLPTRSLAEEAEIVRTGIGLVDFVECETWPDREDTWGATTKLPLRDDAGRIIGTWGVSRDATDRVRAEQLLSERTSQLEALEQELRNLLDGSPDAMVRFDRDLRYVYVNPAAASTFGSAIEDIIGRTTRELGHPPEHEAWDDALREVFATGVGRDMDFRDSVDGLPRWFQARMVPERDPTGSVTGVLAAIRDLTDRKRAEEALTFQAVHDPLTGLANRVLLLDRVAQAVARLERSGGVVAVLFIDLDRFKSVNDTLGHAAGDWLLLSVADRLRSAVRPTDTVARFGGDEFVVLCEGSTDIEDVRLIADRIDRRLAERFIYEGKDLHVTGSVGVEITADPLADAEQLVSDADAAMYQAKARGGGRHQFFDGLGHSQRLARIGLEMELRDALGRGEFELHYQPLRRLSDGRFLGVEALIRWRHPQRGLLLPGEFLDVAEASTMIVDIGAWTINEACRQLAEWFHADGTGPPFTMAVNVSGREFGNIGFVDVVAGALARHSISPQMFCLEISETAMLEEAATAAETFENLTALGVQIALDNFGTGYATLAHLRRFPIDILKIDLSFVNGLSSGNRGDSNMVAAFTAMAHALGITTVGEGIENAEQLDRLREMGCDEGQGYLFSRPVPPADVLELLRAQPRRDGLGAEPGAVQN